MARKKIVNKKLHKGRYYLHRDNSKVGFHPSYIYYKNDNKNQYKLVCFTTSSGSHRTRLNKNINPNSSSPCYVLNSPRIAKRKSISYELKGYKVTDLRDKYIIMRIKKKK